jgi:hypothetical protein
MTTDIRATDSLLRTAIRLDATGVGLIGLAIAAFAGRFVSFTGLTQAWVYGIAAAFVFYGVAGNWLAGRSNLRPIGTGLSLFNFVGAVGHGDEDLRQVGLGGGIDRRALCLDDLVDLFERAHSART